MTTELTPRPLPGFTLVGEDGNAFAIMGRFSRAARRAGLPQAERDAVLADMRSSDYDHLLSVALKWCDDGEETDDDE